MPKKSQVKQPRAIDEIVRGMMDGVPPRPDELVGLAVSYRLRGPCAVNVFKATLRGHVERFKQRSALLRESGHASTDVINRTGHMGAALAWDNAANLLNAELNRP